ncbi:MAG: hypothetical protein BroJett025_03670 [Patescibacteria group bacterium]|nr:MAG: hypothetical protein BroJett025_03670 [Patescibacteria group bacterium]
MGFLPYENLIKLAVEMNKMRDAEKKSHRLDQAYLRWQRVRMRGIPLNGNSASNLTTFKTGFEGYFVNKVRSSDELLTELLNIGKDIWANIRRLHKMNPMKIQELKKTILSNDQYTLASVAEWSGILGAQIGRLRVNVLHNPTALAFQSETRQAVAGLPKIEYTLDRGGPVAQRYKLPEISGSTIATFNGLTDEQKLYWATVLNLGKFGHPLVRAALEELYKYSDSSQFGSYGGLKRRI